MSVTLGVGIGSAEVTDGAESVGSAEVRATTGPGDEEAPTAPANLVATRISDTRIDLAWDASTDNVGVDHYNIYRDDVKIAESEVNSYSNTGLTTLTTYVYKVSAVDAADNESEFSNTDSETTFGLVLIDRTAGTDIGDMTSGGGLAAAFDGVTSQTGVTGAQKSGASFAYVGKTLASAKVFGRAVVYGSNNAGFIASADPSTTLDVYGKDGAAPGSSTDGTIIGTLTFTDTTNESAGRTVESTDLVNTWDHIWVRVSATGTNARNVAELVLYEWA